MNEAFQKLSDQSIGEIVGKPLVSIFGRTSPPLAPMFQTPMECFGSTGVPGEIMDIEPVMSKAEKTDKASSLTHYKVTVAPNLN